jgi:hypothetical protein
MPGIDIAGSEQSAVVAAVLDEICLTSGIEAPSPERDETARLLDHLYRNGHRTADQLRAALDPARLQALFG